MDSPAQVRDELAANLAWLTTISAPARRNIHHGHAPTQIPSMVELPFENLDDARQRIRDLDLQARTATSAAEHLDAIIERRRVTRWLAVFSRNRKLLKELA